MSRPPNPERPHELLDAIFSYLIRHGLSDLSLRPLAKAVGSSPRVLLYHFGSREKMVGMVFSKIREQQRKAFGEIPAADFRKSILAIWKVMSTPSSEKLYRLYIEAYGIALRRPKAYGAFLQSTVEDWLVFIGDALMREGFDETEAREFATVVLAGFRGFMLDYCNTRDRERLDRAVRLWLRALDGIKPSRA